MWKKWISLIVAVVMLVSLLVGFTGCAKPPVEKPPVEKPVVKWRAQDCLPSGHPFHGFLKSFCDIDRKLSEGRFDITPYGVGELVPFGDMTEAVSKGTLEVMSWCAYYDHGRNPAADLFTCWPFGFSGYQYLLWIDKYGGREMCEELYGKWNIKPIPFYLGFAQILGQTKKPYENLDQLKGKIFRSSGLQAEVLKELGMQVIFLPSGELYTAIERGTIDVLEFAGPSYNYAAGFHKVAPHILAPGWHEPASQCWLMVNMDAWKKLPEEYKFMVEVAAKAILKPCATELYYGDVVALDKMVKEGCVIHRLPDSDLAKIEAATKIVLDRYAAKDPFFAKVLASQRKCLEDIKRVEKVTGDLSYKVP